MELTQIPQTKWGGPDAPVDEQGDCWASAVCSLAGLDEEARDHLNKLIILSRDGKEPGQSDWWDITNQWLVERGFPRLIYFYGTDPKPTEGVLIKAGPSPRLVDSEHVVLVRADTDELWWDPHPSGDGLLPAREGEPEEYHCFANVEEASERT